jgi:hypothetical protein
MRFFLFAAYATYAIFLLAAASFTATTTLALKQGVRKD